MIFKSFGITLILGSFLVSNPSHAFLDKLKKGLEDAAKQMEQAMGNCTGSPTSDGRVVRNWQNCRGTFVAKNGNKITGKWQGGRLQGKATITTPKGIVLEGMYKNSKLVGKLRKVEPGSGNGNDKPGKMAKRTSPKNKINKRKSNDVFDRKAEREKIENSLSSGLSVKNVCQIQETWRIKRTNGLYTGFFFKPVLTGGYFAIGGYGTQNVKKGKHCVKVAKTMGVKNSTDLLVPPKDWELVWESKGTIARKDGSFWNAVSPGKDYECLGSVAVTGSEKPKLPGYRCVHSSLIKEVETDDKLYSAEGSGAQEQVTVFRLPETNTFVAVWGTQSGTTSFDLKKNLLVKPDKKIVEEKLAQKEAEWKKKKEKEKLELAKKRKREKERREAKRRKVAEEKKRAAARRAEEKRRAEAKRQEERTALLESEPNREAASKLFGGDPKDVVFLMNSNSNNVRRGLSGNVKITGKNVRACLVGATKFKPSSSRFDRETLGELTNNVTPVKIKRGFSRCGKLGSEKSAILVLTRDISSSASNKTLSALINNVNEGKYVTLYTGDRQKFEARVNAEKEAARQMALKGEQRQKEIANGILSGTMTGLGMFKMENAKSRAICIENNELQADITSLLQKDILKNGNGNYWPERLRKARTAAVSVKASDLENAFFALQENKCGSFFGKTASIKTIVKALKDQKKGNPIILPVLLGNNYFAERQKVLMAEKQKAREVAQQNDKKAREEALQRNKEIIKLGYKAGPEKQKWMSNFIQSHKNKINKGDNAAKKKRIWINASKELCQQMVFKVTNWIGFTDMIMANDDGSIRFEVDIDVHDNEVQDYKIDKRFHSIVENLKDGGVFAKGEMVRFSGKLFRGKMSENECLKRSGFDSSPELFSKGFVFKFTDIQKVIQ